MEPRNVMLEKRKEKKNKEEVEKNKGEEKEKLEAELFGSLEAKSAHGGLLRGIALFLDRHGFSKTLLALQSESQVEIGSSLADSINLEDMYHKYLKDSCSLSNDGQPFGLKEKDSLGGLHISRDKSEVLASGEVHHRKRRSNGLDMNMLDSDSPEVDNGKAPLVSKSNEMHAKHKEKKKKGKMTSDGSNAEVVKEKLENVKSLKCVCNAISSDGTHLSHKDKKKEKNKSTSDGFHCGNGGTEACVRPEGAQFTNKVDAEMVCNEAGTHDDKVLPNDSLVSLKGKKKKHKKSTPEDLQGVKSKDICCMTSHENIPGDSEGMVKEEKHLSLKSEDAELAQIKEKKKKSKYFYKPVPPSVEVSQQSDKSVKMSMLHGNVESDMKGRLEAVDSLNTNEVHANGNAEDKGRPGISTAKTHKKDSKGFAVPKIVNPFQRVNPDEVTFADERLQDNSYWAKSGAETGYGAKAQEVFGQVRGKDFRHEKTKKKRGSYRGGLIDLRPHSVKFNYSDAE